MKLSANWLREFVKPKADAAQIAERLTRTGVEASAEALPKLSDQIIVGQITDLQPHPQADRLRVAQVNVGGKQALTIVCGAANAAVGMKAPVATVGATLPNGTAIRQAALRGVESAGMLCSAEELGFAEKSEGLLVLDADAPLGKTLNEYLGLPDSIIELELTPNRGDCLGLAGLAREVSAIFALKAELPEATAVKVQESRKLAVKIDSAADCPHYAGRLVTGLNAAARTPDWMRERLRRSGLRTIHPLVDITAYVMLELGQPMHAFDAARISGPVSVRRARAGEKLVLLNDQVVNCTTDDLLIADAAAPLALAGVMGGLPSSVSATTTEAFLESACFTPERVARTGRRLRINSDALYRFERGVDPGLQQQALERATQLVLEICGGRAGPVSFAGARTPKTPKIRLRRSQLDRLIGHEIPSAEVEGALKRLGLGVTKAGAKAWVATVPSARYDLRIEADLIEEVARLYGYDRIPARAYSAQLVAGTASELQRTVAAPARQLIARGYQEAVTYSFVEADLQEQLNPGPKAIPLDNPMADTQGVMRTTLWGGLLTAVRHNLQRQHPRVRLFEAGTCFEDRDGVTVEKLRLAGVAAGPAAAEQWGVPARPVDFFDVKADVEALLGRDLSQVRFERAGHPALHPGQSARLLREGRQLGWIGTLHPRWAQSLDLQTAPVLFELEWATLAPSTLAAPQVPSEFPSSRRDLALVVPENLSVSDLLDAIRDTAGGLLGALSVFDVYRGTGLPKGFKSVAFGLIFQDNSRTLTDQEVDAVAQAVATALEKRFGASIRGSNRGGTDQSGIGGSAV